MSPRARTRLHVAVAAALAAALVVGVTVLQADDGETAADTGRTARGAPPLELGVILEDEVLTRDMRAAEQAYENGRRAEARRRFEAILAENPESVEAAVGAAVASWPDGTVERLQELVVEHPGSGVALLHLGLALFAAGRDEEATAPWRAVEQRDPDSAAALRAEDLLHPDMAPGRPPFVAALTRDPELEGLSPARRLAELERRAKRGDVQDRLLLGIAYQRLGRPVSAGEEFRRAASLDPDDLGARVAAALGRFDKDAPAETFSRLGPLARDNPRAGIVRYHLGLCLSWIGAVQEAKRQLRLAIEADGDGFYGREAERLLSRLEAVD